MASRRALLVLVLALGASYLRYSRLLEEFMLIETYGNLGLVKFCAYNDSQTTLKTSYIAVAVFTVMKSGFVIGHVPRNLAPLFSHFLKRSCNKTYVLITGERVNRGAGHGLEAPCVYRLYAPAVYLQRIKALLEEAADLTSSPQPALEL